MLANRRIRSTWASCLAGMALLAAAAGCGGSGGDKAGGDDDVEARMLTLANPNDEPPAQLTAWADEVDRLSGGTLEIEFENDWRQGEADYEAATIEDIQASEVDVAWVGARAFDTVGVTSFQALVAPLLIDSHDLQEAVFEEGIPTEMLDELEQADLAGVGVLPGPMRKPLGVAKPFVTPADYAGTTVGIQDSAVAEQTLAALGATPRPVPSGAVLDGLDAYEQQLASIAGNHYSDQAGYVTANVNLWPRPLVIVMSPDALESLTADQQTALREASAAAIPDALDASRNEDDEAVSALCREGMTLTVASESDLADLRAALEPVYDELAADPTTKSFIDDITTLKTQLSATPEAPQCAPGDAETSSEAAFPEGTYEMTLTDDDLLACDDGETSEQSTYDETLHTLTLNDGSAEMFVEYGGRGGTRDFGWSGTYTVFRDRIELTDSAGTMTARWTYDGTDLTFSDLADYPGCGDVVVWTTHPWALTTG
jgi:TRAP-type C4-dicarboxylate transport system substrate-binding protein